MDDAQSFVNKQCIDYQHRLKTFKDWSNQIVPEKYALAKAGFLYTGQHDRVKCFACHLRLAKWEKNDNPWLEHSRLSSQCWYIKLTGGAEKKKEPTIPPNIAKPPQTLTSGFFMNDPFKQYREGAPLSNQL